MYPVNFSRSGIAALLSIAAISASPAAIVYQDSFNRLGPLLGSAPDVVNTNGNLWQFQQAGQVYSTNGTSANNAGFFGSIYLPVNGTSGVILDGTSDFTLSVTVNSSAGPHMGIALNTAIYGGGDMWQGNNDPQGEILAALGVNTSGQTTSTYDNGTLYAINGNAFALSTTATLTISYSAATDTLTYTAGATTIATQTGVTASQIAALTYVSLDNGAFAPNTGTFDNFTLDIATVPEPATVALMLGGFGALALGRRRRLPII